MTVAALLEIYCGNTWIQVISPNDRTIFGGYVDDVLKADEVTRLEVAAFEDEYGTIRLYVYD